MLFIPHRSIVTRSGHRILRVDDIADRLAISRSMAWKLVSSGEMRSRPFR